MTAFWIFGAALAALALVLLLRPLLRSRKSEKIGRAEANISIYRDQLRELDADLAEGKLTRRRPRTLARRSSKRACWPTSPRPRRKCRPRARAAAGWRSS